MRRQRKRTELNASVLFMKKAAATLAKKADSPAKKSVPAKKAAPKASAPKAPPRERPARTIKRPPSKLALRVEKTDREMTLAQFLSQRGGISLEDAREAVERGGAYVKGKRVENSDRPVRTGEEIELHLLERGEKPKAIKLSKASLLHIDPQVIAIDKPAGVLAQDGLAGGPDLPTLALALLESLGEKGPALLVHRLDRGTTGVTLLARTPAAQTTLLAAFRDGKVKKEYVCICAGSPKADSFVVDLALGADENASGRRRPDPLGQPSRTRFRVLKRFGKFATQLAAFPETGRTHQIRVHLSEQGFPLLGDVRYGGPRELTRPDGSRIDFLRPMLHARALSTAHPSSGRLDIEAPEPADLTAAVEFLAGGES
jgi:23S rRNA pseudouridine1911/1915/1917 synthase